MLRERLHAASRPGRLPLPEPNRAREVATGEQAPIRAPGQREDRAGMRHLLKEGAQLRVPEPDGRIQSPTGEQAAIRSKSHAGGALRLPARPEQSTTVNFPELTLPSRLPLASVRSCGLKARPQTVSVWARQTRCKLWPASRHNHTSPRLPAAQYCPLELMATAVMASKV